MKALQGQGPPCRRVSMEAEGVPREAPRKVPREVPREAPGEAPRKEPGEASGEIPGEAALGLRAEHVKS